MKKPLVSVCLIAYNQEKFIRETLDGIVLQKVDFPIEVVIGDDCSTDRTRQICDEYIEKYPNLFSILYHVKNIGMAKNWIKTMQACRGKYVAICEGDDYWTDSLKLQKQVNLMETHSEYSMCSHNAYILEYGHLKELPVIGKSEFDIYDIIAQDWGIMTASIMFRNDALTIPEWYTEIKNCDYGLQLLVSLKGKIGILPETMSVYRKHDAGVSATLRPLSQAAWLISLLYDFNKYTNGRYRKDIVKKIRRVYKNQIGFAKEYHLRKATVILTFFSYFVPVNPFWIRHLRK